MKKKLYYLFLALGMIAFIPLYGQKTVVVVEPDEGLNVGALNTAIESAADPGNTIFELKRDGLYLLNGSIAHSGYTLHIRGEEGEGSRPVLQPAVDENGESSRHFTPSGDLILESIYIQGRDELGAINSQPIRIAADSLEVLIEDCFIDYSAQSIVRTNSSGNVVMINNSIIRNSILPDNPNNGRVIDSRGNPNDTLWIDDCTIYNSGATQLRSDGGFTKYARFNHNTVYQTSFNHNMALDIILKADITNNVFYNFLYRGNNTQHEPFFGVDSMFTIGDLSDADRYFDLSDNNWYVQQEIGDILDQYGPDTLYRFNSWDTENQDTIWYRETLRKNWFASDSLLALNQPDGPPIMIHFIENGQVDTTNLFREELTFKNPPPLNLEYWRFFTENGWQISGLDPPNAYADEDPNVLGEVQTGAYDFSYNLSSRSATAADGGLPLGASRWTPYTPVSTGKVKLPASVRTYPNPFGEMITFQIDAAATSLAQIAVYDLLGKELVREYRNIGGGTSQVTLNLEQITRKGVYLYRVMFGNEDGSTSIMTGKIVKK